MNKNVFTKGDWFVTESLGGEEITICTSESHLDIASVWSSKVEDAYLMASSKKMYNLLEEISTTMECFHGVDADTIKDLLKEARGETK